MFICAVTQRRFELDTETSDQNVDCVSSRLIQSGRTSSSLASAGEQGAPSMDLIYRTVYTDTPDGQVVNKMQPGCLTLVTIIKNKDDGDAYNSSLIRAGIGGVRSQKNEDVPRRTQAKRQVVEKGVWPIARRISRMGSLGGGSRLRANSP